MSRCLRNRPCPCGSGRKYKKCCALSNPPKGGKSQVLPSPADQGPGKTPSSIGKVTVIPANPSRSRPIRKIDSATVDKFIERLGPSMDALASEMGLSVRVRRATYSEINAKFAIEAATIRDDGIVMDKEAEDFLERCVDFGLVPADLGRAFACGDNEYRIVGMRPRAKLPVICEQLEGEGRVRLGAAFVRGHLELTGKDRESGLRLLGDD